MFRASRPSPSAQEKSPSWTRGVYFDAVGTLIFPDPPALIVYQEAARCRGLVVPVAELQNRFLRAYRAEEARDRANRWVTSEAREHERWRNIVSASLEGVPDPDDCYRELFDHFERPSSWRLADDAVHVLGTLVARGMRVGLGSNYDRRLLAVLDGFPELASVRDRTVISSCVGYRKPAAEFFYAVAASAGCVPHEVLFVGDDFENDCVGASAAGLQSLLLDPDGRHPTVERIARLNELV